MNVDRIINLLTTITLIEMMVTIGLGVRLSDVVGVGKDLRLVVRAALANYIVVPAAAVALLLAYHANPMVAVGILIAAVCPGAPYGPPFTSMAKGNVTVSVGLMVILAGSSAIAAPLLLHTLVPIVAGSEPLRFNLVKMVSALIGSQLLPLCVGLYLRERRPALTEKLKKPFRRLSIFLNLLILGFILTAQYRMLSEIRLIGYFGMLALVGVTVVAGWVFGGRRSDTRTSMVFATSVRNVAVSLVIATGSFPGTPAIAAATAYAVVQTVVMALVAMSWGKLASAKAGLPDTKRRIETAHVSTPTSRSISALLADVDGTLVTRNKVLTGRAIDAVRRLRERDIAFFITSGRPPHGMRMLIRPLGLTTPMAAFNGGMIVLPDLSVVDEHQLPDEVVPAVIDAIQAHGLDVWIYRGNNWYIRSAQAPHVGREASTVQFLPTVVPTFDDLLSRVVKIVGVSDDLDSVARCETATREQFGERVSAARSQPYYLDVTHPAANKGTVIGRLSRFLNIPLERIATIGDQPTDVLMFKLSGFSIAMGNASEELQRQANCVTTSCEDEGFANAVERFILPKAA